MRKFEKISYDQFSKDICNDEIIYTNYCIPERQTINSAGYDFSTVLDYVIHPNEKIKIPTGIKVKMNADEVLLIIIRSSMGIKYNLRMCNQVGVIDSDYYNNEENEGHIWITVKNEGNIDIVLNKNQRFAQGIFIKYLTVDNEEKIINVRKGTSGSTDKER